MAISVDDHVSNCLEISSNSLKLTEELINRLFELCLEKLRESREKDSLSDLIINEKSKSGKMKIKDLKEKHEGKIESLDDNVPKEKLKEYEREFKKLGVDFSVAKNQDNSYSILFASNEVGLIEKALKTITEQRIKEQSQDIDNDGSIDSQDINSLDSSKQTAEDYDKDNDGSIDSQDIDDNRKKVQTIKDIDEEQKENQTVSSDLDLEKSSEKIVSEKLQAKEIDISFVHRLNQKIMKENSEKEISKDKNRTESRER